MKKDLISLIVKFYKNNKYIQLISIIVAILGAFMLFLNYKVLLFDKDINYLEHININYSLNSRSGNEAVRAMINQDFDEGTFSIWVRAYKEDSEHKRYIIDLTNVNGSYIQLYISSGNINVELRDEIGNSFLVSKFIGDIIYDWTNILFTINKEGIFELYVNGKLEGQVKLEKLHTKTHLYIMTIGSSNSFQYSLNGNLRDLVLESNVYSAKEVQDNYNSKNTSVFEKEGYITIR